MAGRSDAESLDAGEHLATLRFRRRRRQGEQVLDVKERVGFVKGAEEVVDTRKEP
jgi:hypothetical protein